MKTILIKQFKEFHLFSSNEPAAYKWNDKVFAILKKLTVYKSYELVIWGEEITFFAIVTNSLGVYYILKTV